MTKIICINGFKRSGKGETGKAIESVAADYFRTTRTLGFADKLKIAACRNFGLLTLNGADCIEYMDNFKEQGSIMFGLTLPALLGDVVEPGCAFDKTITGRQYLQWMGTEYRKLFGENFWVDQVLPRPALYKIAYDNPAEIARQENAAAVGRLYDGADIVAFTDCRFPNEAERSLALGGEVWEVIHPDASSDGHASEIPLPRELVTRQIINDGSLMDLRYKVEQALAL